MTVFQNLSFIKTASGPDLPTVLSSLTPELDYIITFIKRGYLRHIHRERSSSGY